MVFFYTISLCTFILMQRITIARVNSGRRCNTTKKKLWTFGISTILLVTSIRDLFCNQKQKKERRKRKKRKKNVLSDCIISCCNMGGDVLIFNLCSAVSVFSRRESHMHNSFTSYICAVFIAASFFPPRVFSSPIQDAAALPFKKKVVFFKSPDIPSGTKWNPPRGLTLSLNSLFYVVAMKCLIVDLFRIVPSPKTALDPQHANTYGCWCVQVATGVRLGLDVWIFVYEWNHNLNKYKYKVSCHTTFMEIQ